MDRLNALRKFNNVGLRGTRLGETQQSTLEVQTLHQHHTSAVGVRPPALGVRVPIRTDQRRRLRSGSPPTSLRKVADDREAGDNLQRLRTGLGREGKRSEGGPITKPGKSLGIRNLLGGSVSMRVAHACQHGGAREKRAETR